MKKHFYLLLAATLLFTACKNRQKYSYQTKDANGNSISASVDMSNMEKKTDEMNQKMEALKKLKPLTLDQLKALLPEELNGIKRTNFNANTTMGFALAE